MVTLCRRAGEFAPEYRRQVRMFVQVDTLVAGLEGLTMAPSPQSGVTFFNQYVPEVLGDLLSDSGYTVVIFQWVLLGLI